MNKDDFYFFWNGELSQWYKSDFVIENIKYNCCEQYMMYKKAELFDDIDSMDKILKCVNPRKQKQLGREVKNFNADLWDEHKYSIVLNGNLAKFTQNRKLNTVLMKTNDKTIVEASPYDVVWGIGYAEDHPNATQPDKWRGQNLLGKVLEDVRKRIKV